jgi:hypothetical protein
MMSDNQSLPKGFEDLQPFVAYWVRDTSDERWQQRSKASMEDIKRFYEAMLARAEDAIAYLDAFPLDRMPEDAARLFKLLLAIGQAAIAVEMHHQPRAHHSKFPHGIHISQGPKFFGG